MTIFSFKPDFLLSFFFSVWHKRRYCGKYLCILFIYFLFFVLAIEVSGHQICLATYFEISFLCSVEERKPNSFRFTWELEFCIFIFGWTIPLKSQWYSVVLRYKVEFVQKKMLSSNVFVVVLVVVVALRAAVVSEFRASAEICHTSCCGASQWLPATLLHKLQIHVGVCISQLSCLRFRTHA